MTATVLLRSLPTGLRIAAGARPRRKPRHIEGGIHKNVATTLELCLLPGTFWTTFPAGGGGARRGQHLKAMGLKAGVPDLLIAHAGMTLWVELKAPKNGHLSDDQERTHIALREAGHFVEVCRSIADVIDALDKQGIPHAIVLPSGAVIGGVSAAAKHSAICGPKKRAMRVPGLAKAAG